MPENQFVMQVDRVGDGVQVRVYGDLNGRTTPRLRSLLNRTVNAGAVEVCLDLTHVAAFDAAALAAMVTSGRRLNEQHGCLVVRGLSGLQGRLLEICDNAQIVKVTD
jgi:anti-anti-sigma factor